MSHINQVKRILFCIFLFLSLKAFSQDDKTSKDTISISIPVPDSLALEEQILNDTLTEDFTTDSVPTINIKTGKPQDSVEVKKPKPKKKKKKVFYELKCRRGFTKKGVGDKTTIEFFYTLKTWKDPNPYSKEIYVFNYKKATIEKLTGIDPKKKQDYLMLHGPYKKMVGGKIIEEGIFYIGTKHGRWELYDKNFTLLDKTKYYKGWPKESKLTFYDGTQTKLKEVLPYEFNQLSGDYFLFKENGSLLKTGQYKDGLKSGTWVVYFPNIDKVKREVVYPKDPLRDKKPAYVHREWNENGNLIFQDGKKIELKQPKETKKTVKKSGPPVKKK
jgi:antitoxin component YwqK of YwqJK toxin-antitoxin module